MIKKTLLITILLILVSPCGKKGDPEYKDPEKKVKTQTLLIYMV